MYVWMVPGARIATAVHSRSVCHWPQRESSISASNCRAEQICSHEARFTKSELQGVRGILAEIVLLCLLSALPSVWPSKLSSWIAHEASASLNFKLT